MVAVIERIAPYASHENSVEHRNAMLIYLVGRKNAEIIRYQEILSNE